MTEIAVTKLTEDWLEALAKRYAAADEAEQDAVRSRIAKQHGAAAGAKVRELFAAQRAKRAEPQSHPAAPAEPDPFAGLRAERAEREARMAAQAKAEAAKVAAAPTPKPQPAAAKPKPTPTPTQSQPRSLPAPMQEIVAGIQAQPARQSQPLVTTDEDGFELDLKPPWKKAKTLANTKLAVTIMGFICSYNTFNNRYMVETRDGIKELSDQLCAMVRNQILTQYGFDPGKDHTRDAMITLCLSRRFNPVVDWLDELEWDGVHRLDGWLSQYAGADDTPLNAAIGRKVLCAMVRRAKQPGCKFDHVMVLEGDEDIGKSTLVYILGTGPGEGYFSDASILSARDREQQELAAGIWCYELGELTGIRAASVEKVKQFITRLSDRGRPAYGHFVVDQPRQTVFIGTTNDQEYLTSQTGNRRWWPVFCTKIDLDGLRADRDQLFAEAVLAEPEEKLFIGAELFAELRDLHESRRTKHPWEDHLARLEHNVWVGRYEVEGGIELRILTRNIMEDILEIAIDRQNDASNKRLSQIMQRLGWTKTTKTIRVKGRGPAMGYVKLIPLLENEG